MPSRSQTATGALMTSDRRLCRMGAGERGLTARISRSYTFATCITTGQRISNRIERMPGLQKTSPRPRTDLCPGCGSDVAGGALSRCGHCQRKSDGIFHAMCPHCLTLVPGSLIPYPRDKSKLESDLNAGVAAKLFAIFGICLVDPNLLILIFQEHWPSTSGMRFDGEVG